MTPDELKAHRRKICEALIEGKQAQVSFISLNTDAVWQDVNKEAAALNLFTDDLACLVRIKPQPRQCWVGWCGDHAVMCDQEQGKGVLERYHSPVKWQLVTENTDEG